MPKRIAVELKCERCKAVWYEDYTPGDPEPAAASLELTLLIPVPGSSEMMSKRKVHYEVLCKRCASTVANYVNGVELDAEARKKAGAKKKGARAQGGGPSHPPEPKSPTPPRSSEARRPVPAGPRDPAS